MSNVNALGITFTVIMAAIFLVLPRKYAVMPLLMTALYLTQGQVVVVASLFHFTMLRIMFIIGFVRIAIKREYSHVQLNKIDIFLILYIISSVTVYTILWQTTEAFTYIIGFAYNAICSYFLFRCLIKDYEDYRTFIKIMGLIIVPLTAATLIEWSTGRNVLSFLGGVPEFSEIRNGRVRCQGSFGHPILLGMFGATSMPLFAALWFKDHVGNKNRMISAVGFICTSLIMIAATSSGALMSYAFAIIGLMLWYFKDHMRVIRWGIVFSLIILHFTMKAPVWFLMGRLSEFVGGGGYHRSDLIDQAIKHFDEWWLLGTKVTGHWMPTQLAINPDSADITNHFIGIGIRGGLISLALFIMIIVYAYKGLGKTMKNSDEGQRITLWTIGVSLLAHLIAFMSVAYFDQIVVFWYMLLAIIASLTTLTSFHSRKQNEEIRDNG